MSLQIHKAQRTPERINKERHITIKLLKNSDSKKKAETLCCSPASICDIK